MSQQRLMYALIALICLAAAVVLNLDNLGLKNQSEQPATESKSKLFTDEFRQMAQDGRVTITKEGNFYPPYLTVTDILRENFVRFHMVPTDSGMWFKANKEGFEPDSVLVDYYTASAR